MDLSGRLGCEDTKLKIQLPWKLLEPAADCWKDCSKAEEVFCYY